MIKVVLKDGKVIKGKRTPAIALWYEGLFEYALEVAEDTIIPGGQVKKGSIAKFPRSSISCIIIEKD